MYPMQRATGQPGLRPHTHSSGHRRRKRPGAGDPLHHLGQPLRGTRLPARRPAQLPTQ